MTKEKLLTYFKSGLEDAKYEVDKISAFTAPEDITYRNNKYEYYHKMYWCVKEMLEH